MKYVYYTRSGERLVLHAPVRPLTGADMVRYMATNNRGAYSLDGWRNFLVNGKATDGSGAAGCPIYEALRVQSRKIGFGNNVPRLNDHHTDYSNGTPELAMKCLANVWNIAMSTIDLLDYDPNTGIYTAVVPVQPEQETTHAKS